MLEYLKSKLNQEQYEASKHIETSSLIIAGAWSGKTRTLTYKIAYLIYNQVPVNKILAVTFTNKASKEMKERILQIIQEISIDLGFKKDKYLNLDWIGTFHSIFLKILTKDIEELELWYKKNFTILDSSDTTSIIGKIIKDMWWWDLVTPREIKSEISKMKNQGIDYTFLSKSNNIEFQQKKVAGIYWKYQETLLKTNSLDFDDLLLLPYLLFRKKPEILTKWQDAWQYILVDEAQDTNRIQFELMKMLTGKQNNITFIWDDYQSIYWRRWAVMENFLNLKKYWPDIVMFKLQTNYRSLPHIVQAGNHIIQNNKNQYEKIVVPNRDWDNKIFLFQYESDMSEAYWTMKYISETKSKNNLKWSDFAVLYRTNSQSALFEKVCIQKSIPYIVFGAFRFFEREEIKDILAYLKFILNPKDDISFGRIINKPKRNLWDTTIDKIREFANYKNISIWEAISEYLDILDLNNSKKNTIWQFVHFINQCMNDIFVIDPADFIEKLAKDISYRDFLLKQDWKDAGQEKRENIWQLINMAQKYNLNSEEMSEKNISQNELMYVFLEEVSLMTDASEKWLEGFDTIKFMTIHTSKWLEFKNVFVVWLEQNIFPLSKAIGDVREMEEERRLMYVAITRAQDQLFLSYCNSRMQWGSLKNNTKSDFIDEIPKELIQSYELGWLESSNDSVSNFEVWDIVRHKLFGKWEVIETRKWVCVVRLENIKFGYRKIENKFLELVV